MMMMGTLECKHLIATFLLRLAISNALYSNRASRSQTLMLLQCWEECNTVDPPLQVFVTDSPYLFGLQFLVSFFVSHSTVLHAMAWDDGLLDTGNHKLYKRCMRVANAEFRDLSD